MRSLRVEKTGVTRAEPSTLEYFAAHRVAVSLLRPELLQPAPGLCGRWLHARRLTIVRSCGFIAARAFVSKPPVEIGQGERRIALNRAGIVGDRLGVLASVELQIATIVVRQRVLWVELDGGAIVGQRLIEAAPQAVSDRAIDVGNGKVLRRRAAILKVNAAGADGAFGIVGLIAIGNDIRMDWRNVQQQNAAQAEQQQETPPGWNGASHAEGSAGTRHPIDPW